MSAPAVRASLVVGRVLLTSAVLIAFGDREASADICHSLLPRAEGPGAAPVLTPLGSGELWTQYAIGFAEEATDLRSVDMDGDGDFDVAWYSRYGLGNGGAGWWENAIDQGSGWIEHTIVTDPAERPWLFSTGDLNGDHRPDLILGSESRITWWKNPPNSEIWTEEVLTGGLETIPELAVADIDRDNDLDLYYTEARSAEVRWLENQSGDGTLWRSRPIRSGLSNVWSVTPADLDGDGDPDLAVTSLFEDETYWLQSVDPLTDSWEKHTVSTFDQGVEIGSADLDADGDTDLYASTSDGALKIWINDDGNGESWTEVMIVDDYHDLLPKPEDLDADGDLDLVASPDGEELRWFENLRGDAKTWDDRLVSVVFAGYQDQLAAVDLDGDGDPDLVDLQTEEGELVWWENRFDDACDGDGYVEGARLGVAASPEPSAGVSGWQGTVDDPSRSFRNTVEMPGKPHEVTAEYVGGCHSLETASSGPGAAPTVSPVRSNGCPRGEYTSGERLSLTAAPDAGATIERWEGTIDDDSLTASNELLMPPEQHTVEIEYAARCFELVTRREGPGRMSDGSQPDRPSALCITTWLVHRSSSPPPPGRRTSLESGSARTTTSAESSTTS